MPLSAYYAGRSRETNALVLGFASSSPDALTSGMERLAAAIEAAERGDASRARGRVISGR